MATESTPSSGNVFADLGLPDADVLKLKSGLVIGITMAIRALGLSQQAAGERMGINDAQFASLAHSGFDAFSEHELRTWLAKLKG
ncbi:helix-turn-helix domain-containing protein [Chitiniphilus shinanonensis]|uniref:helix-turn-helix domain-containing protein n=1 Tax=Chitiniphilus shinanonensis TaxID=553088 RepID=UPI00305743F2